MRPCNDSVLVKEIEDDSEKRAGGIILPGNAVQKIELIKGQVIAVGPGKQLESGGRGSIAVAVGEIILFPRTASIELADGDKKLLIIREEAIIAVLDEKGLNL